MIEGFVPIIARTVSHVFPPFLFVGVGSCIAMSIYGITLCITGGFRKKIPLRAILYAFAVAAFVLSSFALIFWGSQYTSGVNIALLIQTEMLSALLIGTVFLGERATAKQLLGAFFVLIGTVIVLYNGSFSLNKGDVIILFAATLFPIGNVFAKKALQLAPATAVLFYRYVFGTIVFLGLSLIFENPIPLLQSTSIEQLWYLPLYGILVLTISKLLFYTGLKVFPMSTATFIISAVPAYSLLFAWLLLAEVPTSYQWVGFFLSLLGVFVIIRGSQSSTT